MAIRTLTATWTAADGSTGSAKAVITLDTDLVTTTPGNTIPVNQVQELTVTVQGARAGNGTYGKADYTGVQFYAGFALDFSEELIGQTGDAGSLAYGTPDAQGGAGDFNLVSAGGATAPAGVAAFTLATNGRSEPSDVLVVSSIRP